MSRLRSLDFVPATAIGTYLLLILLLPKNHNSDPWIIQHRGFTWAYLLVLGYCGAELTSAVANQRIRGSILIAAIALAIFAPIKMAEGIHAAAPSWSSGFVNNRIPRDLLEVAKFLRAHSYETELVQTSDMRPDILAPALTERPAYLVRPEVREVTPTQVDESRRRLEVLNNLRNAKSLEELKVLSEQTGIRWYISTPSAPPPWVKFLEISSVYSSNGFLLFDLFRLTTLANPEVSKTQTLKTEG